MYLSKLIIKLTSKKVGQDMYGNTYYLSKKTDDMGRNKRYVIYNGIIETSKIPPVYHAWIHYMIDDIQAKDNLHAWQSEHLPNLTGTSNSHLMERGKVSSDYQPWQPN